MRDLSRSFEFTKGHEQLSTNPVRAQAGEVRSIPMCLSDQGASKICNRIYVDGLDLDSRADFQVDGIKSD